MILLLGVLTSFIMQLSKVDARIMRNVAEVQQLELKLEPVSAHDYRAILLPLVKSYLRVCIPTAKTCAVASHFT